jgi:O-antigen ligase
MTKRVESGEVIYKNSGQIVSFNNLYINLYFSAGLIGLLWFLIFVSNVLKKLYNRGNDYSFYIFTNLLVILLMYFFQAEELSTMLAISLGLMLLEFKNEKV